MVCWVAVEILVNESILSQVTKDDLIHEFVDFSRAVAFQMSQKLPIDPEDAMAQGYLGLVEAADKFDLSRYDPNHPNASSIQTNFKSFAYLRIRGAIVDYCRSTSFVKRRGMEKGIKFSFSSLDVNRSDSDGNLSPMLELPVFDSPEERIDFIESLKCLDHREKVILVGIMAGFSGRELSERLGITQTRVAQLGQRARAKLRN